jgi:hypothetical protein
MHVDDGRRTATVEMEDARLIGGIRRPRRSEGGERDEEESKGDPFHRKHGRR